MSTPGRKAMLDRRHPQLSIRRQCALLGLARSGAYRLAKPPNDNDLGLMRRLDELFTDWPFLDSRRMAAMLRGQGLSINRKRVQRLMRKMGIDRPQTADNQAGAQDLELAPNLGPPGLQNSRFLVESQNLDRIR